MTSEIAQTLVPPAEWMQRATVLAGEPAWSACIAKEVVAWLASQQLAVVGVELWQDAGGVPKWMASSDYQPEVPGDWASTVQSCADGALAFISAFEAHPGRLFNLTWTGPNERTGEQRR